MDLHLDAPFRLYLDLLAQGSATSTWKKLVGPKKWLNLRVTSWARPPTACNANVTATASTRTASRSMSSSWYCVPLIDAGMAA
jgi:hypothetical protein